MRSLQARLAAGLFVSLGALFVLQWLLVIGSIRFLAEEYVGTRLEHDAESLLAALSFDASGAPQVDVTRINPIYLRPFSGHYYRIYDGGHDLRSRSLWDQDLAAPVVASGVQERLHAAGPQDQDLLILVQTFRKTDRALTIAVAEDLSPIESDIRGFQLRYALISLLVLAILVMLQYHTLRSGLRPLEQLRRELMRLERGEIGRLDVETPAEVSPLVAEINRLLEIIGQRLRRSRNALGNVAHALKTPLTVLTRLAESDEKVDAAQARAQMSDAVSGMRGLLDRELKRARLAGSGAPGQRFVPGQELPALIETLAAIYRDKAPRIQSAIPEELVYAGDREDMLELFGNLLDNACKWCRAEVRLTVEEGPGLVLRVEDDGPGVPDEDLDQLVARGVRMDEFTAGHGLGLAIVGDVVEQYGGTLRFGRSPALGGFLAEVRLP